MELQKDLPNIQALNASVVAVSVDPVATSKSLAEQLHLGFPILEDTNHQLGSAMGDFRVPSGMDMGPVDSHAIYIVGPDGTITWKDQEPSAMHVPDGAVLAALRTS